MNALKTKLGLSDALAFYDVYSLDNDPSILSHIPRPALALLVIIPLTPPWAAERNAEDAHKEYYNGAGASEPVIWFQQTIGDACGSIGLLHSVLNSPAAQEHILSGSALDTLRRDAVPLGRVERAQMLYDSQPFEEAHASVAGLGDSAASLPANRDDGHFVAFVKGADGNLWELEGNRKGPINRGKLAEDEDVLSPRALEMGLKRVIKLVQEAGVENLRFSCTALAPNTSSS